MKTTLDSRGWKSGIRELLFDKSSCIIWKSEFFNFSSLELDWQTRDDCSHVITCLERVSRFSECKTWQKCLVFEVSFNWSPLPSSFYHRAFRCKNVSWWVRKSLKGDRNVPPCPVVLPCNWRRLWVVVPSVAYQPGSYFHFLSSWILSSRKLFSSSKSKYHSICILLVCYCD